MTRLAVPERGWEHTFAFVARWTGWTMGEIGGLTPYQLERILAGLTRVMCEEQGQQDPSVKEALQEQIDRESERKVREALKDRKGKKISMRDLMAMDPSPEIRRH